MGVLHWCMLGVSIVLLMCEVTISQLCKSLIILVDGFHTLFILMRMASTPPPPRSTVIPPHPSLDSPAPPPHAYTSSATLPGNLLAEPSITTDWSVSPPALNCSLSYSSSRIQPLGAFLSAVLLVSLCISYILEIISLFLAPQLIQRPLLVVVVSAVSLLYKMLMLWLNWDQQQDLETESHNVLAEGEGRVLYRVNQVQSAADNSLHNGALVLRNPGTSSVPDADSETPESTAEVYLQAAGSQNASNTSPVCESSQPIERPVLTSQRAARLPSLIFIVQCLCTPLLALINSLVVLNSLQCLHSSGACTLLVYLDPIFTLVAVITLIVIVTPQAHRSGLLLAQATPPQLCVTNLGQRIASVPGVQTVQNLHVWQLTESLIVASVHVHCHAGFPTHRCADLMSGVTKVLQSVGVSCCTIEPMFASCSALSAASGGDTCPVTHSEDPSLLPHLACNPACGSACNGNMCCSSVTRARRSVLAPPAGEMEEEPQTLVIENAFL